ncbi:MAG TPA: BTAD domain-containing putative transcriptional regulator [Actinophytocola sp.]|jgi:DNA-binding SARP family transcriptional activator|uniref:AfsR/SARP family transcriptional regulator n=1 Tax=Actinophytocola sp. TaxID=1872138 RepID=UPI002E0205FF|nr:BTAD domain-containing putative transcriptional regulator [Actinophytocola sp.]
MNQHGGEASAPRLSIHTPADLDQDDPQVMQVGLLGPLTLRRAGQMITPSAPKLRQVLSLLVLQANSVTRVDQLVEELWEESPPPSALTTVQTYIYQLRKLLKLSDKASGGRGDDTPVLLSHPGGYILQLRSLLDIDAYLFEQLAERGRQGLLSGQVTVAADTLRVALGLWRGSVLEGVSTGPLLYAQVARLAERRRTVLGLRIEADLQLGRHQEITGELASLVSAEPTREDFSAKLMLALYRCGRRADALQVYQRIRTTLVEELGLDPATELQRLHQLMLAADPSLDAPSGPAPVVRAPVTAGSRPPAVTPAQLPAEIPDFVGRSAELGEFERTLPEVDGAGLRVVNLVGRPGIGKSTFAVHAARAVRDRFPDGQLYVDLSGTPSTRDVLVGFLTALGADEVPASAGEAALMFRSWTADRRLLVVLDDCTSREQMHQLLPGGPGCTVVITSRNPIGGLPGAVHVKLPVLTPAESVQLLTAVVGESRVEREPAAALELVELADRLPLALRAVAAKLAARPGWQLSRMVGRLSDERHRLEELCYGGFDVLGRLAEAYQLLTARQRWVFRRLAAASEQPLTINQISELVSMGRQSVEAVVDELVDADLVEERQTRFDEPQHVVPGLIRLVGLSGTLSSPWWSTDKQGTADA